MTVPSALTSRPGWFGSGDEPLRILLLRHGETPMSVAGVFSGRSNPSLTDTGMEQARRAAAWLRVRQEAGEGIDAVYTSPLTRARQTAEAAAGELGLPVTETPDLIETDFGAWEGLGFDEVHRRWPGEHAAWANDPSVPTVGGESMDDVSARCDRLVADLDAPDGPRTVLLVSHVSPIKAILRSALQAPATVFSTLHLSLAGLSVVEFYSERSVMREFNDTHYLRGM
ncbi:histidine phosphatase family protein [Corynebacterium terpenotabidum]|uniref:Bifunctional RNase H/acid phosphatase n=1 Tax=Corynebacterium terpenotabidum Y-11 TaxID=1200352 RepID=S4XBM6_9CORY|nr:histidine phosphatase family protein [Corynebacterium terpenotabidum]AGP30512.1 bifunctional RNase H/acid phosphatase [Corynebacterium terpenotabidum Y-11]